MATKPTYEELEKKVQQLERKDFVHKQLAGVLREREEKIRVIFETVPCGVQESDLNGKITLVNTAFSTLTGYDKDELLDKYIWDLAAPGPQKDSLPEYIKHLVDKQPEPTTYNSRNLTKDGRIIDIQIDWDYKRDENGKLTGFVSIISDITERQCATIAQEELNEELSSANEELNATNEEMRMINEELSSTLDDLRDSEAKIRTIAESSLDAIVMTDHEARISYWNKAAENMFGFLKEEVLGELVYEILAPERLLEDYKELHHTAVETGRHPAAGTTAEFPVLRKGGEEFVMEVSFSIFKYQDKWNTVSYVRDVTERKLIEEERRKNYLNHIGGMIVALNIDGTVDFINETGAKSLGYEKEAVIKKNWFDNFLPERFKGTVAEAFNLLMTGKVELVKHSESHILRNDGEERVILWDNVVLYDADGTITGTLSSGEDITERKRIEQALIESEETMRTLSESAQDAIILTDDKGLITYCNSATESIFGYSRDEIIGKSVYSLSPDEIPGEYKDNVEIIAQIERGVIPGRTVEFIGMRKNKEVFPYELSIALTHQRGKNGRVGIIRDITEQKKAAAKSKERVELLDFIFEHSLDSIVLLDKDYNFIKVSESYAKLCNRPVSEFQGRNHFEMYPSSLKDEFDDAIKRRIIYKKNSRPFTFPDHPEWGVTYWDLGMVPIRGADDRVKLLLFTLKDVTERMKAEEEKKALWKQLLQSQKLESVGRLTGGIAHDFNNLLTGILGYGELALRGIEEDSPLHKKIKIIVDNTERAANLVKQLLAFSRKQVLDMKPSNLNIIVEDMSKMLKRLIGANIKLNMDINKAVSNVTVDKTQMGQVLMNLAVNARDSMPDGGGLTIKTEDIFLDDEYCKTHPELKPASYVMLSVEDTGTGMTKEVQDKVFEPFFTTKEESAGTGLGLSTVFGIVKQHNGSISLYSEPGKGTVFKVYIPATKGAVKEVTQDESAEFSGGNETVLIVDDDDIIRGAIKELLEDLDYKILEARSGEDAIEISNKSDETIDLLLTDVIMTGINGWNAAKEIKKKRPEMKVIFSSGYMDNPVVLHNIVKNKMPFINKPYKAQALVTKIREILDEKVK